MNERNLIKKIQLLNKIEPDKDWAFSLKTQILGVNEVVPSKKGILEVFRVLPQFSLGYRFALASLVILGIMAGTVGFSQLALPGDTLYPVKRLAEKAGLLLIAKNDQPKAGFEIANKRLEELKQVAQKSQSKNLAPALNEFHSSLNEAVKGLKTDGNLSKLTKDLVQETEKLQANKEKVEAMGVVVGETKGLNEALGQLVEQEIKGLEASTLSESQLKLLEEVKAEYAAGNLELALENLLLLTYPQK